jgi:hypothetical protein
LPIAVLVFLQKTRYLFPSQSGGLHYTFAEWRSRTRLRLISCLSIRQTCDLRPHCPLVASIQLPRFASFLKDWQPHFSKLGGLVLRLDSTYTPLHLHLLRYAAQVTPSATNKASFNCNLKTSA